jgi:hypothetical protein
MEVNVSYPAAGSFNVIDQLIRLYGIGIFGSATTLEERVEWVRQNVKIIKKREEKRMEIKSGAIFQHGGSKRVIEIIEVFVSEGDTLVWVNDSVFGKTKYLYMDLERILHGYNKKVIGPVFKEGNVFSDGRNGGRYITILGISPRVDDKGIFSYFIQSNWNDGRINFAAVQEKYLLEYARLERP